METTDRGISGYDNGYPSIAPDEGYFLINLIDCTIMSTTDHHLQFQHGFYNNAMKMNRKAFISNCIKSVLGACATILLNRSTKAYSDSKTKKQEKQMKQNLKFVHDWISNLMKNMDSHLDEETKIKIMEECGRACAKNHTKKEALKSQGQLDGWLTKMKKWIGEENVQKEKNLVRVIYSKCYCPILQDSQPILSNTYCHCSRGWLKENFETVLERPVKVKLEDSIMRGGKQCRFSIFL